MLSRCGARVLLNAGLCALVAGAAPPALAVDGNVVLQHGKVAPPGTVGTNDFFGSAVALLGDLNGAGGPEIAVGAEQDDSFDGAVYVFFLDTLGVPVSSTKILAPQSLNDSGFGHALAFLGNLDGDGFPDLAIGSPGSRGANGVFTGVVWIAELDPTTGAVTGSPLRIASGEGGFPSGLLDSGDLFGSALSAEDLNGDGRPELIVGARFDADGGSFTGAIYILYLNANGTVAQATKISDTAGGLDGAALTAGVRFGSAVAAVGDQDGDGQVDLAVSAPNTGTGQILLVFLKPACGAPTPNACGVKAGAAGYLKIAHGIGGFPTQDYPPARFGSSLAWLPAPAGSVANDRLAVGDNEFDTAGSLRGAVWLFEVVSGQVLAPKRISSQTNWGVTLDPNDGLGGSVASLGDLNGDYATDLAIGAIGDDDTGSNTGTAYLARLSPCATIITRPKVFHDPLDIGHDPCVPVPLEGTEPLHLYIETGGDVSAANACTGVTPADGDEMCAWDVRISVAPPFTVQSFTPDPVLSGELLSNIPSPHELRVNWIDPGTPQNGVHKIGDVALGIVGEGGNGEVAVANGSAAVGAELELHSIGERRLALPEPAGVLGLCAGVALIAALARRRMRNVMLGLALTLAVLTPPEPAHAATSIQDQVRITWETPNFNPPLLPTTADCLGESLTPLGDLDGDGTLDLALKGECSASFGPGRVYTLFLEDGAIRGYDDEVRAAAPWQNFGVSVALLPDRNGDGVQDLLVGESRVEDVPAADDLTGRVSLVFLRPDGLEAAPRVLIGDGIGGIPNGTLEPRRMFGSSVAWLGDVDGNGTREIGVGAPVTNSAFNPVKGGEVWLLSLNASNQVVARREVTLPGLGEPATDNTNFGASLAAGDLDGDGVPELVVGAPGSSVGAPGVGAVYVLFLAPDPIPGPLKAPVVEDFQRIRPGESGLALGVGVASLQLGLSLAWLGGLEGGGAVIAAGNSGLPSLTFGTGAVYMLHLRSDATVGRAYRIAADESVGAVISATHDLKFGSSLAVTGEFGGDEVFDPRSLDGDEVPDLLVGASAAFEPGPDFNGGAAFLFFLKDSDYDGLDDALDNCKDVHNPQQEDRDADGVGDLCDNCVDLANANQADSDTPDDGEGDVCEPVEVVLQTTGTPATPSWSLSLQCGAFSVTNLAGAIVMPAGAANPKTLSLTGTSIGSSGVSGPGLVSPTGVRSNAIYFTASGNGAPDNRLCTALAPPVTLGTLTTGAISGTQLAAAALTAEGVGVPGFGLALAKTAGNVVVPLPRIRLVNGLPLPLLDLQLGPAVQTASGTRWEVCVPRASEEFHRVAFGLIAPNGTTTSQMRWVGCNTPPNGNGQRSCPGGGGFAPGVNPLQSWTVGPAASPPGTLLSHTMYVVLEGGRFSSGLLPTLNFPGQAVCLGAVELDSSPDLEPALTTDGVNDLADYFGPGLVEPFEQVLFGAADPDQVKLIGAFNPADDLDGDGTQDLGDICPFIDDAQTNRGSFLDDTDESDAFGDACQCAESTNDGAVLDPDDFDRIRDYLAGLVTNPVHAQEIEERCSVAGTTDCNIRDLVYLKLAIDAGAPAVETRCDAALSPAQEP